MGSQKNKALKNCTCNRQLRRVTYRHADQTTLKTRSGPEHAGNPRWKGMTWGMMPLFAGALCACTYHFFYNSPDLDSLVAIQAGLTWIGNATLWSVTATALY